MIKAAVIAALAIPVLSASAADYRADLQTTRTQADTWCANFTQIERDLKELGVEIPGASEDYTYPEEAVTDDTKIMSELGMMFDAGSSRIIYLGNVRLIDKRLCIKAGQQLHIHLPGLSKAVDKKNTDNQPAKSVCQEKKQLPPQLRKNRTKKRNPVIKASQPLSTPSTP